MEPVTDYPVLISSQTAVICPHASVLRYRQTYQRHRKPGHVFADFTDEISWTFATRSAGPVADAARLVVAGKQLRRPLTVWGAVEFTVPASGNTQPREIFIRSGVYEEIVFVTNQHHLTFRGENRTNTTIQYANNENFNYRTLRAECLPPPDLRRRAPVSSTLEKSHRAQHHAQSRLAGRGFAH